MASGVEKGGRNREVEGFRSGGFIWLAGVEMEMMVMVIVIKVNGGRWDWKRVLRVGFLLIVSCL